MKKRLFILFLILNFQFLILNSLKAQDSSRLQISLLTCTPGDELYSTFGHTAFRIIDSNSVTDIVYNYGTFDFDDESFYIKFAQGKLLYYLSTENFSDFKYAYQAENRGITEQILNLTAKQKTDIQHFLNENLKQNNKYYKYDFFFDNCTTRPRDIIKKYQDSGFVSKPTMPLGTTFRNAIHQYLENNNQHWSKLGIDILLGRHCDAIMTSEQMQFLPNNLMKSLDSSKTKIILSHQNLYPVKRIIGKSFFTPLIVFVFLLIFIVSLSFIKNRIAQFFLQVFDGIFLFSVGLLGTILTWIWITTDNKTYTDNFNLLWAWPVHIIMVFFIYNKKKWVKMYFGLTSLMLMFLIITWLLLPQKMNPALLPIVLLLIFRSFVKFKTVSKSNL